MVKFSYEKCYEKLRVAAGHWAVFPALAIWSGIDYFVLFIPSEPAFAAALIGRPKRVVWFSLAMCVGRFVGIALIHGGFVDFSRESGIALATQWGVVNAWERSERFFNSYGALSLAITAVSPFPMIFPTILGIVAKVPLWQLEISAALGLTVRYFFLSHLILKGHRLVMKRG